MILTKCFGIISWLPDKEPARQQRKDRINRLFKQLNDLWPEYDILIITQNWKDFEPNKYSNKLIRVDFKEGLGILKARKTLRKEFLKLSYDYLIMFDDDAIIHVDNKELSKKYIEEIDRHKNGFAFIQTNGQYNAAQLNMCAISKYILKKEDIPNTDPQKNEAYEDCVFANLLHYKYTDKEFSFPNGIKCIQFQNRLEVAPSTWSTSQAVKMSKLNKHTNLILGYLKRHSELPNLELLFKYDILCNADKKETDQDIQQKIAEKTKKRNAFGAIKDFYLAF